MARAKFISLTRIWYTIFVVIIHLILIYFGIKQCYFNDRLTWPKTSRLLSSATIELYIQKLCLVTSFVLLFLFIYPALFRIGNYSNDEQQLTNNDFKKQKSSTSICAHLWHHSFSLSCTLHLAMSFLILISTILIDAKQIMVGLKDSTLLWRTDFDLLTDWSPSAPSSIKYSPPPSSINQTLSFSIESYTRLSLVNFLLASFICILREPKVFWSISKLFSFIYSFALLLNVIQWCLMYCSFQLLIKNICFNTLESTLNVGYLLLHQPYTSFFLYLLLEFLIYISSITFYYYAYNRFKIHENFNSKSTCYERCSHYCPSLIAIVILLLYTSCKMPLVHDIFLLYIQTHLQILFVTFIFEIVHVLLVLALWIYLTTKTDWHFQTKQMNSTSTTSTSGLTVKNSSIQPPTAISMPELHGECSSASDKTARRLSDTIYQKPYEKIRIFQSEIYYRNRPKDWSLPANQQAATMLATFDNDDDENDIVIRSTVLPTTNSNHNEIQYREAIRKTVSNLYKPSILNHEEKPSNGILVLRNNTPPSPRSAASKRFAQEQVEAARIRAQQLKSSTTLLVSQV